MVKVRTNLTGQKFGRLTVIEQAEDYINPKGVHYAQWRCKCDCGNPNSIIVSASHLKNGHTLSCGCLNIEAHIKYNDYDLSGEYGVGYTSNGKEFYFDLEDYGKIKDYTWYIDKDGYVVSDTYNKHTKMHKLIMNPDKSFDIDHADGHNSRNNNKKSNLRIATRSQNNMNKRKTDRNKSGYIGVYWNKAINKWQAKINANKKSYYLGSYDIKEDALIVRLKAEKEYFGEFAPQKYLFEQYGIEA